MRSKELKDYSKKTVILIIMIFFGLFIIFDCGKSIKNHEKNINRLPRISPDYSGIVIPPNIAPLNFRIMEKGLSYRVKISSANQAPLILMSEHSNIYIPIKSWKKLRQVLF